MNSAYISVENVNYSYERISHLQYMNMTVLD